MVNIKGIQSAIEMLNKLKALQKLAPDNKELKDTIKQIQHGIDIIQAVKDEDFALLEPILHGDFDDPLTRVSIVQAFTELMVKTDRLQEELTLLNSRTEPVWEPDVK